MSKATDHTTTRRALLAGAPAAAAGALAVAGIANTVAIGMSKAEGDPMLVAVARYKAAVQERLVWGDEPPAEFIHAEFDALDEMVKTTPTTLVGIVAALEVLGSDPYRVGGMSAAAWSYNGNCEETAPVDRLMLAMAGVLRGRA
jgi:hypothetical protein